MTFARCSSTRLWRSLRPCDRKGLYGKARRGELPNFTAVDAPYEGTEHPEIHVRTAEMTPEEAAERVIHHLGARLVMWRALGREAGGPRTGSPPRPGE